MNVVTVAQARYTLNVGDARELTSLHPVEKIQDMVLAIQKLKIREIVEAIMSHG